MQVRGDTDDMFKLQLPLHSTPYIPFNILCFPKTVLPLDKLCVLLIFSFVPNFSLGM